MPRKPNYAETRDEKLAELRKHAARPERREQNTREFKRLLAEYGDDPVALRELAATLSVAGLLDDALKFLETALQRLGPRAELLCGLADLLLESGRTREAIKCLVDAASAFPAAIEPRRSLARVLLKSGRRAPAVEQYRAALKAKPGDAECELGLALALQSWGRYQLAIPHFKAAIEARPKSIEAAVGMGVCLHRIGDFAAAASAFRKVLTIEPKLAIAIAGEAAALAASGQVQQALARLQPFLAADTPVPIAATLARFADEAGVAGVAIGICERASVAPNLPPAQRAALTWSLGDLLESAGEIERAFQAYTHVHQLLDDRGPTVDVYRGFTDQLMAMFTPETLASLPRATIADERLVFIVGAPQSGTRLVESILAAHPSLFAAGELRDISDWLPELSARGEREYPACLPLLKQETLEQFSALQRRWYAELGGDATRVTDASPMNCQHLGLIWMLLPGARVIHVRRDPLDTCFAWFSAPPGGTTFRSDLPRLAGIHAQLERLMAHWKAVLDMPILDVYFEQLVAEPETQTRRMVEFCGLPWDEACLRPHESKRFAQTHDLDRARRPIDASSVGRARRFGAHLGPLPSEVQSS